MMAAARRGRFDVVLVWASDRIGRWVKHYLEVLTNSTPVDWVHQLPGKYRQAARWAEPSWSSSERSLNWNAT